MSWAQRLEVIRKNAKAPGGELTKLPEVGFVSFGSAPDGASAKFSAPQTAAERDELRARLRELADREGLPLAPVDGLTDADLAPENGAPMLGDAGLIRWLHVLAENARMQQGIAPPGWTQPSHCHHCGPVSLWPGAPATVLGCPWCHVRRAGGKVPRPAVTCATCAHQQLRPDTSDTGMHACGKGHGLHFAGERHGCGDWKPRP
ncbi:hypothetical protein [Metallibacterium sp.]|uniref:hypothetical protein n=1 Tax=Metallibacterium sp. TaxID=2940281 RepID=UPI00261C1711|nr:hypothetical protein [Metallibacterium sp.]